MIDSHCHLDSCASEEAVDPTLNAIITIGTDFASCERNLALAEKHPNVYAALGVHPNSVGEAFAQDKDKIAALYPHPKAVGVGETGFDSYWNKVSLEAQEGAFDWHAEEASRHHMPLILHVRDAQNSRTASARAVAALKRSRPEAGILHCYNGDLELLETALGLGWYVSFAGNLTYKSAKNLQDAVKQIPVDRLLVETDSPYLSPEPKRGRANKPAHVRYTAAFLAQLLGVALQGLEPQLDLNAKTVYNLPLSL